MSGIEEKTSEMHYIMVAAATGWKTKEISVRTKEIYVKTEETVRKINLTVGKTGEIAKSTNSNVGIAKETPTIKTIIRRIAVTNGYDN
jgi:hypothetical protein